MPKQKTHKGLSKRVKLSANGKVVRRRAGSGHLLSGKSGKRLRKLRKPKGLRPALVAKIRELLTS
jgi:large subunit ribosomal protein L35